MEQIFDPNTVSKDILQSAQKLLQHLNDRSAINPQRAATALGQNAVSTGNDKIHVGFPLDDYQNLIVSFNEYADKDQNDNYISQIFERPAANGTLPLWHKFFVAFKTAYFKDLGESKDLTLTHVYFGTHKKEGRNHYFSVSDMPKQANHLLMGFKGDYDKLIIYTKNSTVLIGERYPRTNSVIYVIAPVEPQIYQDYYDNLRLQEAIELVRKKQAEKNSLKCHNSGFRYLMENYPNHIADFRFDPESFRFSGFNITFYYDEASLAKFDDFYHRVYLPHIEDNLEQRQWKAIANEIERRLFHTFRNGMVENNVRSISFKKVRDNCLVESDLIDDYTGKNFHYSVKSHDPDEIYQVIEAEFIRVFRYKRQLKEISSILRKLSTKAPA